MSDYPSVDMILVWLVAPGASFRDQCLKLGKAAKAEYIRDAKTCDSDAQFIAPSAGACC